MLQKEELQFKNLEINKKGQQPEIKILNIPTFDALFNLAKIASATATCSSPVFATQSFLVMSAIIV